MTNDVRTQQVQVVHAAAAPPVLVPPVNAHANVRIFGVEYRLEETVRTDICTEIDQRKEHANSSGGKRISEKKIGLRHWSSIFRMSM